jgi:hypothetical protein
LLLARKLAKEKHIVLFHDTVVGFDSPREEGTSAPLSFSTKREEEAVAATAAVRLESSSSSFPCVAASLC